MISPKLARDIRTHLQLDVPRMAELTGVSPRQWFRYESGQTPVPAPVEKWLTSILRYDQVRQDAIGKRP